MTKRVFVSYRNLDSKIARIVFDTLRSLGFDVFLDEIPGKDEIEVASPSSSPQSRIALALERCDLLVALITRRTRGGWWVPFETGFALGHGKPVVLLCEAGIRPPDFVGCTIIGDVDRFVAWAIQYTTAIDERSLSLLRKSLFERQFTDASRYSKAAISSLDLLFEEGARQRFVLEDRDYAMRGRWLGCKEIALIDLLYDLTAPMFLARRNDALVDGSEIERAISGLLYQTWINDELIAEEEPSIKYAPRKHLDWRELRQSDPARYWLQGMRTDEVEKYFSLLSDENRELKTRQQFHEMFRALYNAHPSDQKALGIACNAFQGFSIDERPVFARLAAIEILLHQALLRLNDTGGVLKTSMQSLFACERDLNLYSRPERAIALNFIIKVYGPLLSRFDRS